MGDGDTTETWPRLQHETNEFETSVPESDPLLGQSNISEITPFVLGSPIGDTDGCARRQDGCLWGGSVLTGNGREAEVWTGSAQQAGHS